MQKKDLSTQLSYMYVVTGSHIIDLPQADCGIHRLVFCTAECNELSGHTICTYHAAKLTAFDEPVLLSATHRSKDGTQISFELFVKGVNLVL